MTDKQKQINELMILKQQKEQEIKVIKEKLRMLINSL